MPMRYFFCFVCKLNSFCLVFSFKYECTCITHTIQCMQAHKFSVIFYSFRINRMNFWLFFFILIRYFDEWLWKTWEVFFSFDLFRKCLLVSIENFMNQRVPYVEFLHSSFQLNVSNTCRFIKTYSTEWKKRKKRTHTYLSKINIESYQLPREKNQSILIHIGIFHHQNE